MNALVIMKQAQKQLLNSAPLDTALNNSLIKGDDKSKQIRQRTWKQHAFKLPLGQQSVVGKITALMPFIGVRPIFGLHGVRGEQDGCFRRTINLIGQNSVFDLQEEEFLREGRQMLKCNLKAVGVKLLSATTE